MLKDSRSYEVQIIDAVRSVNRALGGTYGTSSAIYKNEFNQYEVQLIDAIKGIGRTLSGKGLSLAGGAGAGDLSGYATIAQFQDLSRRVTILENESFFRLVDGNVTLKEQYQNLWVPGWLAAGGIGTSGGGGGVSSLCELDDVYHTSGSGVLRADGTDAVPGDSLVYNTTLGWVAAPVSGGGGSGTVTGVKMNGTTLSPSTTGIVDLGTVITSLSGYATEQWVGQQGFLTASALSGYATQTWVQQQGYLTSYTETDPTVPAWAKAQTPSLYVGTTQVQTSSAAQDLTGILSIKASSASASKIEWEPNAGGTGIGAWHFYGNVYADGWVSAGGIGSSGGGGGSTVEVSNLLSSGTRIATLTIDGDDYDILAPSLSGMVTSIKLGTTSYNPNNGVVSLPAYPTTLPASDVYAWAKASSKPSYAFSELTSHPTTISGYGITDAKIANGVITLGSDTITPLTSHQAIYKLTLNAGSFTAGEYTPNSAAKTFNIPTTLDHVADGTNRKLADYLPLAGGTMTGDITMNGANIVPQTTGTCSVGLSTKRFGDIYGVDADLSGDLTLASTSHIDIGPVRIVFENNAIHITKKDPNDNTEYGIYADGFVSAGGIQQTT